MAGREYQRGFRSRFQGDQQRGCLLELLHEQIRDGVVLRCPPFVDTQSVWRAGRGRVGDEGDSDRGGSAIPNGQGQKQGVQEEGTDRRLQYNLKML